MKTDKKTKKTVARRGSEESVPISLSVKPGMERVLPLIVGPRSEIDTDTDPGPQLGEYFRRGRVRAIQVACLDPKAGTLRDQQGTVWPIIDRRVRDSGAGPGDWLIVDPDGSVTKCDDRTFKDLFEPAGGWPGEA